MADDEKDLTGGEETQDQKNDKVSKKHAEIMKLITSILGGEEKLKPQKTMDMDVTARIVAELFKEESEAMEIEAKAGLKDLLKKYLEYQSELLKERKKLDELDIRKKKEFNEAANKWLQKVDRKVVMSSEYAGALKTAFSDVENED